MQGKKNSGVGEGERGESRGLTLHPITIVNNVEHLFTNSVSKVAMESISGHKTVI